MIYLIILCFLFIFSVKADHIELDGCPFRRGYGNRGGVKLATIYTPDNYTINIVTEYASGKRDDWFKMLEHYIKEVSGDVCMDKFNPDARPLRLPKHATFQLYLTNTIIQHRIRERLDSPFTEWVDHPNAKWNCFNGILKWIDSFC